MQILIVDDDRHVRVLLKELMEPMFDQIIECENGVDAVTKYEHYKPDVVLMDIKMPQMDGITATEKIIKRNPNANVLIVSEQPSAIFKNDAIKAGATKFFLKDNLLELQTYVKIKYQKKEDND